MRLLELFSGTHSVGRVASSLGLDVVSLDLHDADINTDIMTWDHEAAYPPGHFDMVWASPPCETFSIARRSNIGRNGHTRESMDDDMLRVGVPLLRKTREILGHLDPVAWFVENPQTGRMKDFWEADAFYYDVDYCRYSDWGFRKRTRVWTNVTGGFEPLLCDRGACGQTVSGRHIRTCTGGTSGQKGYGSGSVKKDRHKIPEELVRQLLLAAIERLGEERREG